MFNENLAVFFNPDDFAEMALFNGLPINGILGKHYVTIHEVETAAPTFTCRTADVLFARHGDEIMLNAMTYRVVGVHPDNTGVTVLILEQQ